MAKKDLIKRADGSYSPRGLWDNIRANKGSGKAPTKEMLAQEKKITREMAKGGKLSSFYPSNIQAYAEGGDLGKGAFYASPYYANTLTGSQVPSAMLGYTTVPAKGRGKEGWQFSGQVGMPYQKYNPANLPSGELAIGQSLNMPSTAITDKLYGKIPLSAGLEASYTGIPNYGKQGRGYVNFKTDYNPNSGLGVSAIAGPQFTFGRENYSRGELRPGYATAKVTPYGGIAASTASTNNATGLTYGVLGEGEWKPRFMRNTPFSLYGKGSFGASPSGGEPESVITNVDMNDPSNIYDVAKDDNKLTGRPTFRGEVGVRMPVQQLKDVNLPKMPDINLSPLTSFLGRADKEGAENLQMEGGDPMGDFGPRYNASPIDKRWNKGATDIYVPSTKSGLNEEPIIYDPNDPEGLGENNFKQGGAMNFKSPAAYKAWLAYGHASGQFAKTPGNQPVSIQGKSHKVQHAFGGNMYSMGGRAFADGGQLTQFTEGGTHEQNPLGGIPQGFAPDGKLNLVEQGETKLNATDYVFSDQIKVSKETATLYDLPKNTIGKTFADASKKANRPNSRRENDTIEQVAIQRDLENLMQAQEQQKETEKQAAIAEMQAKYPDVQVVDQAAMQQANADMQAGMQQPMMDEAAMMEQQQQMAPPAQAPQEMDPAMMAQMEQQGMMSHGGKMYNMGGHMYSMGGRMYNMGGNMYGAGGGMMALRGLGSAAYGVGEGVLNTLTFGLTDNLTRKGYEKLSEIGDVDERQAGRLDAARGFGNVAGAVTGAAITGGAATKSAISEGVEGLASGVAALPGTGERADQIAQGVGQLGSMYGAFTNPTEKVVPQGALEGSKAASKLMNAPQNPFITKAMSVGSNFMAQGGFLGQPTNGMFTNQFAPGGPIGEPVITFNINGTPVTMSYSQAIDNPTLIDMFMPENADVDGDGRYSFEDINLAKEELREYFTQNAIPDTEISPVVPSNVVEEEFLGPDLEEDVVEEEGGMTAEEYLATLEKPAGMSESEFKKMKTNLTQKETLGEMKASPLLAAATALPAIYNIGRGIFGKVDQLDAKDYQSKARISPYEMNVDPQLAAAQRAYSTAMQATRNAAPGAGSYLATLGNLATQKQQSIKDLYAQKENFDKAQKLEADKFNAQVEQGNMAQDLAIQQYNAQAKAAKQNMLATGLSQVADVAAGLTSQDLQEKYLQTIAPEFAGNFKYMTAFEQLAATAAARKAAKATKSTQG
jgi:hypothetical protein